MWSLLQRSALTNGRLLRVRRLSAMTTASEMKTIHEFRTTRLHAIEKQPVFGVNHLEDTILECLKMNDLGLANSLVHLGLDQAGFDPSQKLVSYHLVTLLEGERVHEAAALLAEMHQRGMTPGTFVLEQTFAKICDLAADKALDRLVQLRPSPLVWTETILTEAILRVYLRSHRHQTIRQLLLQTRIKVKPDVWLEIFTALLQPSPLETPAMGEMVERCTDRRFDRLQGFLEGWRQEAGRLPEQAVDALDVILERSMVPPTFISFLESFYKQPSSSKDLH